MKDRFNNPPITKFQDTDPKKVRKGKLALPAFALAVSLSLTACTNEDNKNSLSYVPESDAPVSASLVPESIPNEEPGSTVEAPPSAEPNINEDVSPDSEPTQEVLKDIPVSEITEIRFRRDNEEKDTALEQQGWINPREKTLVVDKDNGSSFEPDNYDMVVELTENKSMLNGMGEVIHFSNEIGLDNDGELIGLDDQGDEAPFNTALPYHSNSTNEAWFLNEISQLPKGSFLDMKTKNSIIYTFELKENRALNKIGDKAIWQKFDGTFNDADIVSVGCLVIENPDGSYSTTQQVQAGMFKYVKAKIA